MVPATNRITGGYLYDAAGNLYNDTLHNYTYDGESRITAMDTTVATYVYDGHGMRVRKAEGATTALYIFSGTKVIAEYTPGALASSPAREYVYAGNQLLVTVAGGSVTYALADQLSARAERDAAGQPVRTLGHLPFGDAWYETGTASKWKFTSYERDNSGLDYAMFRYYSPRLGRFMTPDPAGLMAANILNPQSWNAYSYTGNSPSNARDPLGLDPNPPRWQSNEYNGAPWFINGSPGVPQECRIAGMASSCELVYSLLETGDLFRCPGSCSNFRVEQGPRGTVTLQQRVWVDGYIVPYNYDFATGYVYFVKELGHWSWQNIAVVSGSGTLLENGDVPLGPWGQELFQGNKELWQQSSMTANRLAAATPFVPLIAVGLVPELIEAGPLVWQLSQQYSFTQFASGFIQGITPGSVSASTFPEMWGIVAGEVVSNWSTFKRRF